MQKQRYLLRLIVPAFPSFNVFSGLAKKTTALGPICVATMANKLMDWDVEIIDENNYKTGPKDPNKLPDHRQLQQDRPADIVGFYGSLTSTIPRAYTVAKLYKSMGVFTIAGGKHITALPKEALNNGIDIAVTGEGEYVIINILKAWQNKIDFSSIRGVVFYKNNKIIRTKPSELIHNFDKLPLPDFGLLRHNYKINIYPISRVRGCNMNCEFCCVKDKVRPASAKRLFDQVAELVEKRNAKSFFIVDDHFSEDAENAILFCSMIAKYRKRIKKRLSFSVQIRLNQAKNTRLLHAMKDAGIKNVFIGYESPIDEELISMRKGYLSKDMIAWSKIFSQYGFYIHGMFIFGYPKQNKTLSIMPLKEKVKKFKKFINKAKIDTVQILLTVPIPGTDLRKRLIKQKRVFPTNKVGWEYYDGQFVLFNPDGETTAIELQEAAKKIMSAFYHFNHLWKIVIRIIYFPIAMMPAIDIKDIRYNYKSWRHQWRNDLRRFGGHLLVVKWIKKFKKDDFLQKVEKIQKQ